MNCVVFATICSNLDLRLLLKLSVTNCYASVLLMGSHRVLCAAARSKVR